MKGFMLALATGGCIAVVSSSAMAVGCNDDEIEVYRDKTKIVCKSKAEYVACIKGAGEKLKSDLGQSCGAAYKDCFSSKNLDISLNTAACLAAAIPGCGGVGQPACAAICNVLFTAQEWAAYHSCSVDITPCYETALTRDKERKEICKRE
jgi:hypothetical protein